jgi:16S rRNA (guanine1207-N2)-methyltransferase
MDQMEQRERGIIEFRFFGRIYRFATESGLFSYREIDEGTGILLEVLVKAFTGRKILQHRTKIDIHSASILDLGCGYGVIGMLLADILRPKRVVMVDSEPRAVSLTRKNVRDMRLTNIAVAKSNICTAIEADDKFDLIVTNPPIKSGRMTVLDFIRQARGHLAPNGEFWAVIMSRHGAKRYLGSMRELFSGCEIADRESGYMILRGWVDG